MAGDARRLRARRALDVDPPAVRLRDATRDREPEPGAGRARVVEAARHRVVQRLEDPVSRLTADARALVVDREAELARLAGHLDEHLAAVRRELHRVLDDVRDRLAELPRVDELMNVIAER